MATTEKPEDGHARKKDIDLTYPDDPPTNDHLYILLGCLFAGFWIFLCVACALCYKCKQRRGEEISKMTYAIYPDTFIKLFESNFNPFV